MARVPSGLVTAEWLVQAMRERADVVVVDCRYQLGDPDAGRGAYRAGHIPGARYADLACDLSAPVQAHGGRHPFPTADAFALFMARCGIAPTAHVVAYDEFGDMAPRLWFLLRYFGHEQVSLLQGGIQHYVGQGYPLSAGEEPVGVTTVRPVVGNRAMLVFGEEILRSLEVGEFIGHLVDARAESRYRGETEPLDPVAGHIPGACNIPWQRALDKPGLWKSAEDLARVFANVLEPSPVVYCGSGVTACADLFALSLLGVEGRLYAGSWSDWCSYTARPVATGCES